MPQKKKKKEEVKTAISIIRKRLLLYFFYSLFPLNSNYFLFKYKIMDLVSGDSRI